MPSAVTLKKTQGLDQALSEAAQPCRQIFQQPLVVLQRKKSPKKHFPLRPP